MRFYNFDPTVLEPFEIGAWLYSVLGWPGPGEAEQQVAAAEALCALTLEKTIADDVAHADHWRSLYPYLAAIGLAEIKRRLRTLKRRIRDRMIASRMALGFVQEGLTGRPAMLPTSMARLSLNELSKLVQPQSRLSDPEMVERRIWRESRYVIHLAVALQVCGRAQFDGTAVDSIGYDLGNGELHKVIIEFAAMHEEIVLRDKRFGVRPDELVRLRQPGLLRAA